MVEPISIRRRHAFRQTGLAQALDDALILHVEGRIAGPVDAGEGLHGEAGCYSSGTPAMRMPSATRSRWAR
jgi:hypothetical protein